VGAPVALRQLMVQAGFTTEELDLLRARAGPVGLARGDRGDGDARRAGEVRDASGAFTLRRPPDRAMAIRTMFDSAYQSPEGAHHGAH